MSDTDDSCIMSIDYHYDIHWYHHADTVKNLRHHKVTRQYPERFVCDRPGYPMETKDKDTLDAHLRQIHDRIMWVCPIRTCHRRFVAEEETLEYIEDRHTGQNDDVPNILLDQYRMFDIGELRRLCRVAENTSSKRSRASTSAIKLPTMMLCAMHTLLARLKNLSAG